MMVLPGHTPRNSKDELFALWHDKNQGEEIVLIRFSGSGCCWQLAIYGAPVWPEPSAKSPRLVGILCSAPELRAMFPKKRLSSAPANEELVVLWDRSYGNQVHADLATRTPNGWRISRNGSLVADSGVLAWLCTKRELLCATLLGIDAVTGASLVAVYGFLIVFWTPIIYWAFTTIQNLRH